jgi:energy-coupling factor transport system ATP-binding protein
MIRLENIRFSYPDAERPVFSALNLEVQTSAWLTVAGPDGAGKTTLGKLMKGLLLPQSGSITLDGGTGGETPFISVGYVGGDPSDFLVGISVEEDIAFGLENLGLAPREISTRLDQALHWTGLYGMGSRLTDTLSSGEQQKLALASTLALGARVLVLDEAMVMLDRPTRMEIRKLINGLRIDPGLTVIEISNNSEDLAGAKRVLFLMPDAVIFDGAPADFLLTPHGRSWTSLNRGRLGLGASRAVF